MKDVALFWDYISDDNKFLMVISYLLAPLTVTHSLPLKADEEKIWNGSKIKNVSSEESQR